MGVGDAAAEPEGWVTPSLRVSKSSPFHILIRVLNSIQKNKVTYMYNNKYMRRRCAGLFEGCVSNGGADQENGGAVCDQAYAMAYVKPQAYGQIMSDGDALLCGTLFPSLYLPFEGGRC